MNAILKEKLGNDAMILEMILDEIIEGVSFVSRDREILFWNRGAEKITGYKAENLVGKKCSAEVLDFVDKSGCHHCDNKCPIITVIAEGKTFAARVYMKTTFEKRVPVDIRIVPIRINGKILGGIEIFSDATIAEALESELSLEPLSRFPVWQQVETSMDYEDERIQRYGIPFSVIVVQVDHYDSGDEELNESFKTRALDSLGDHLRRHVRKADLLCRYDDDKFAVLMPHTHKIGALQLAERLRDSVDKTSPSMTICLCVAERKKNETVYTSIRRAADTLESPKGKDISRVRVAE